MNDKLHAPIYGPQPVGYACEMAIFAAKHWDIEHPFAASAWYYADQYVGEDADMDPMHPDSIY